MSIFLRCSYDHHDNFYLCAVVIFIKFLFYQDIQSGTVITDEAFEKLKNSLCGLVAPVSEEQ